MRLSELPKAKGGRAAAVLLGGFTIRGFLSPTRVTWYTRRAVPVAPGRVWIGAGYAVEFDGAGPRGVRVSRRLEGSFDQTISGWAPCGTLSLDRVLPRGWDVPGSARGFVSQSRVVPLFAEPARRASPVFSARARASGGGILFWSTQRQSRSGFVHLEYDGDVVIDAWARRSDLKALPWGERSDRLAPPRRHRNAPVLKLKGEPRRVELARRAELRLTAKDSAAPVGAVEPGMTVYVLSTVAGWASVLPASLDLTAPGGGPFWISAKALE